MKIVDANKFSRQNQTKYRHRHDDQFASIHGAYSLESERFVWFIMMVERSIVYYNAVARWNKIKLNTVILKMNQSKHIAQYAHIDRCVVHLLSLCLSLSLFWFSPLPFLSASLWRRPIHISIFGYSVTIPFNLRIFRNVCLYCSIFIIIFI